MTNVNKPVRLSKAAREFNLGIGTIVDFLDSKGISVDANPNTKLYPDVYAMVRENFKGVKDDKEQDQRSSVIKVEREPEALDLSIFRKSDAQPDVRGSKGPPISKNSDEQDINTLLLSQLKQIQDGQNEILRTVADIASFEGGNDMSLDGGEQYQNNISLTRIRYSESSLKLYEGIEHVNLRRTLCDSHTRMEISRNNFNTVAEAFHLIKQLELLCYNCILKLEEQVIEIIGVDCANSPLSKHLSTKYIEEIWKEEYKNGEDWEISSYSPPKIKFSHKKEGMVVEKTTEIGVSTQNSGYRWYVIKFIGNNQEFIFHGCEQYPAPPIGSIIKYKIFKLFSEAKFKQHHGKFIINKDFKGKTSEVEVNLTKYPGKPNKPLFESKELINYCLNHLITLNVIEEISLEEFDEMSLKKISQFRNDFAHNIIKEEHNKSVEKSIKNWTQLLPVLREFID